MLALTYFNVHLISEKSTVDFTTVEVTGFVTIPNDVRSPLPVGSCLNMFVQESIFCLYCNNPVLGRARISNPTITNRKTPYKIKLKDIKGKNQFLVQATLNVGWCGVGDEWIRYNDFHNEYLHEFSLEKDQNKASRDVDLVRYQSKKPSINVVFFVTIEDLNCLLEFCQLFCTCLNVLCLQECISNVKILIFRNPCCYLF